MKGNLNVENFQNDLNTHMNSDNSDSKAQIIAIEAELEGLEDQYLAEELQL